MDRKKRTVAEQLPARQKGSSCDSHGNPIPLHNEGSHDEERGGDIDGRDLVAREGTGWLISHTNDMDTETNLILGPCIRREIR